MEVINKTEDFFFFFTRVSLKHILQDSCIARGAESSARHRYQCFTSACPTRNTFPNSQHNWSACFQLGGGRCSSNDSREKQKPTWAAHITVQSQNVMNESLNSLMGSSRSAVAAGQRSVSREKRGSRGRWGWGGGCEVEVEDADGFSSLHRARANRKCCSSTATSWKSHCVIVFSTAVSGRLCDCFTRAN